MASFTDLDSATPDVTNDSLFGDVTLNALLGSNTDLNLQEGSLFNIRDTIEFGTPYTVLQFDFQVSGAREIILSFDTVDGVFSSSVNYIFFRLVAKEVPPFLAANHLSNNLGPGSLIHKYCTKYNENLCFIRYVYVNSVHLFSEWR